MGKKERNEVAEMLVLILQISITMLVPILLCTWLGTIAGNFFQVKWIAVAAFFAGAAAGFQNVYRLVKKYLKEEKSAGRRKREQDEQRERGENESVKTIK